MNQDLTLYTAKKKHILYVLELCKWNRTHAAETLQISQKVLRKHLKLWQDEWGEYIPTWRCENPQFQLLSERETEE